MCEKYGRMTIVKVEKEWNDDGIYKSLYDDLYEVYDGDCHIGYIELYKPNNAFYFIPRRNTKVSFSSSSLKGIANLCDWKTEKDKGESFVRTE